MTRFFSALCGLALGAIVSAPASASTVSLDYDGIANGLRVNVAITNPTPQTFNSFGAGSLSMFNPATGDAFIAWCIDVATQILPTADYHRQSTFLDSVTEQRISQLFTGYGANTSTNTGAAAMQLAIWELIEEGASTSLASMSLLGGNFSVVNPSTSVNTAIDLASSWLGSLDSFGADYRISYLISQDSQDVITVAPIPLPASILLLGAGLGAFAVVRRRGKKAAATA